MQWSDYKKALGVGALLALPAPAQEPGMGQPIAQALPGFVVTPSGPSYGALPMEPTPLPTPDRPGLFGWRRKHAEHKRKLQEKFVGRPEEFNELPLGFSLYQHGQAQVTAGAAARLIFNHYDFVGDTPELNYRGQDKLRQIANQMASSFNPVIIERTPWKPELAERRRLAVLGQFAQGPFPVAPERVVVDPAISNGLRGTEAQVVNANRYNLFSAKPLSGSLSGSGLDGSGLSGGTGGGSGGSGSGGSGSGGNTSP